MKSPRIACIGIVLSIVSSVNAMQKSSDSTQKIPEITLPLDAKTAHRLRKVDKKARFRTKHANRAQQLKAHLDRIALIHAQLKKLVEEYKELSVVPYARIEPLALAAYNASKLLEREVKEESQKEKKYAELWKKELDRLIKQL